MYEAYDQANGMEMMNFDKHGRQLPNHQYQHQQKVWFKVLAAIRF